MYLKTRVYFVNHKDHTCVIDLTDTYLISDNSVSPYIRAHDICPGIIPPRTDIPANAHIYFNDCYYKVEDPTIGKALLRVVQSSELDVTFDHEISLMKKIDSVAKRLMDNIDEVRKITAEENAILFKKNVSTISLLQKKGFFAGLPKPLHARIAADAIDNLNQDQRETFINRACKRK